MSKLRILMIGMLITFNAQAQGTKGNEIYLGVGVSNNDIGFGDDAIGFQVFAGMPIPVNMGKARLLGEVGYMDSGDFEQTLPFGGTVSIDAKGIWANGVVEVPLNKNLDLIGRLGFDFGDDDGLMLGGGIGLPLGEKAGVRFEYVIRDNIDSLQANLYFRL